MEKISIKKTRWREHLARATTQNKKLLAHV